MSNKNPNKIKYGLKNLHYSVITEDTEQNTVTYGTPERIYGAASISLKATMEQNAIPGDDDALYVVAEDNQGYDGDLEVHMLPDGFKKDILGWEEDQNGVLYETKNAKTKPFALLFEFDGDAKKTRHIMYRCITTKPDIESTTKGEKIDSKTDKISIKCRAALDTDVVKARALMGDSAYEGWFSSVYLINSTVESQAKVTSSDN